MFKYMKRLASSLRFWWCEMKQRSQESERLDEIESDEWRHPMAGFGYYMTTQHCRKERKK